MTVKCMTLLSYSGQMDDAFYRASTDGTHRLYPTGMLDRMEAQPSASSPCFYSAQVRGAPHGADRVVPLHAYHLQRFRKTRGKDGPGTAPRGKKQPGIDPAVWFPVNAEARVMMRCCGDKYTRWLVKSFPVELAFFRYVWIARRVLCRCRHVGRLLLCFVTRRAPTSVMPY